MVAAFFFKSDCQFSLLQSYINQMVFCAREKVGRLGRDKEGNVFLHGTMIIEVGRLVMVIMLMMVDLQTTRSRSIIKRYNEKE